jgi:hypothetical protein
MLGVGELSGFCRSEQVEKIVSSPPSPKRRLGMNDINRVCEIRPFTNEELAGVTVAQRKDRG